MSLTGRGAAAVPATTVTHGPPDRPWIALTFDDNYYPSRALAVLDVLQQYDAEATMFVVGNYVTAFHDITQAIAAGGFEVGDHSLTHAFLNRLPWDSLMMEIGGGVSSFTEITGIRMMPLLRPPYGATSSTVAEAAGAKGFRYIVLWDVDTGDWKGLSAETIRDSVLRNAHNGAIVLMHLAAPNTAAALPGIITGLRARGYELVTVSKLLKGGRRFLDVAEGTPGAQAALRLVDDGYMSGYDENYFGPTDPMTRAQLAKVAVLVAAVHTPEVENTDTPTFADVLPRYDTYNQPIAYPFDYVEEATAAGILAGRADGGPRFFDPDKPITRGQLAQVVARMARELKGYPPDYAGDGPWFPDVPAYAAGDVAFAARLGLMNGYSPTRFDPWSTAQRAHVALVMSRYLDLPAYQESPTTTPSPG